MSEYKSFINSKQKLQKLWEQNERNTSEISNTLQKFEVNGNSINFNKKIITIPIINQNFGGFDLNEYIAKIQLNDFPEWLLNHIQVVPIVKPVENINTDKVFTQTTAPNELETGQIQFVAEGAKWFVKLAGENNYELKIALSIVVIEGATPNLIPLNLTLDLKIINPRIYENTNYHKS